MAFLIPFWFLELAALGIYFYLILRAMRTYGYHLLFLLLIALVLAVVTLHYAFVAAYVVGWLKVRRWALQRIMCCWTVSLILLLPLLAMGESVALPCLSVLGPLSMGLALWCWRSSERLRQALRELRLNRQRLPDAWPSWAPSQSAHCGQSCGAPLVNPGLPHSPRWARSILAAPDAH